MVGWAMEEERVNDNLFSASLFEGVKVEEAEEEDYRSCCEEVDDLEEKNESMKLSSEDKDDLDEFSVRMYFKGVSAAPPPNSDSGLSGIGVVMERPAHYSPIRVQKRIDFFVNECMANYLALMDGLVEAKHNKIMKVFAFTDSQSLYDEIMQNKCPEDPLLMALRQRILEHTSSLETFTLKFVSRNDLQGALELAKVAVGLITFPSKDDESRESCSVCCEEKLASMMMTMKCSHKFCSHCMKTYVEGKLESAQVPVRCPQLGCAYCLTTSECKAFLPVNLYDKLEKALGEARAIPSDSIYCPHPNCSVLLDPSEFFSSRGSSTFHIVNSCLECPVCKRLMCVDCKAPWHTSMSCKGYENFPFEETDASNNTLHCMAGKRWRSCQQCCRMIELSHGGCRMTCWDGEQTCRCACEEDDSEDTEADLSQEYTQWASDSYDSLPLIMDTYSDEERAQLALIHRFLDGSFSLSDQTDSQFSSSCTDTSADAMNDLHQLPWLERFVSVIGDNYYDEYI